MREEDKGAEGIATSIEKSGAQFPLLLDVGEKQTSMYSGGAFNTYLISPDGVIREHLDGTKVERPTGEAILGALQAQIEAYVPAP